ncbi:MAG: helix-turn-helix domain-containing protein [Sedimentisphaerales bacterium]|nr:helix-turn-helix domain-containing protein [Sedimentisphaerales bacterium]
MQNKNAKVREVSDIGDTALLDVNQVASLLNCSSRTVYRLSDAGCMPRPVKLGSLVRWERSAIESWIADGCPKCKRKVGQRVLWRKAELSAWVAAGRASRDKWINIREMMMKTKRKTIFPVVVLIVKLTIQLIKVLL